MADVKCAVCGEPWDAYGSRHGDVKPWEAVLFRAGAGCPSCEGKSDRDHTVEHMETVILDGADDDPDSFARTVDPDATRPEWKRPPDAILFECAGCDSKITGNIDWAPDSEFYREWSTPSVDRNRYEHRDETGELPYRWSTDLDDLYEIDGKKYCAGCAKKCDDCGSVIFCTNNSSTNQILYGDTYDAGASFPDPRDCHSSICVECLEKIDTCSYCGSVLGDDVEYEDKDAAGACCGPVKEEEEEADDADA